MNEIELLDQEIGQRAASIHGEIADRQERISALSAERIERLEALKQRAEDEKKEADKLEATANGDSTNWLTPDELSHATARQSFVLEDMQAAQPDDLINRINQAIDANDKPLLWLYRRYLPQRWQEYNPNDLGLGLPQEYSQAMSKLDAVIVPDEIRTAKEKANEQRQAAEQRRVDAAYELWKAQGSKGHFNPFK